MYDMGKGLPIASCLVLSCLVLQRTATRSDSIKSGCIYAHSSAEAMYQLKICELQARKLQSLMQLPASRYLPAA